MSEIKFPEFELPDLSQVSWQEVHDAVRAYGERCIELDRASRPADNRVPSWEALEIIALSVAHALNRAGFDSVDDPGEAIDVMRERFERRIAELESRPAGEAVAWNGVQSAAKRVIEAFEAHGKTTPYTRESERTRHECEVSMVALDNALKSGHAT